LTTGIAERDRHLRSRDFFDVDRYPSISFRSTGVGYAANDTWSVTGDLTIHGVTRPIHLDVEFDGATASPSGDSRIGFSAVTEVDREDWGLTWNVALEAGGVLVARTVRIELAVQAVATHLPRPDQGLQP
jgi:polyisoprenoid-binding protein YceI